MFGSNLLEAAVISLNVFASFVTFGHCISYLNVCRHKLSNKVALLELFDSLVDVNLGTF